MDLPEILFGLPDVHEAKDRWSTMRRRLAGNAYQASFTHAPLNDTGASFERHVVILQRRFGTERIAYPPAPAG